MPDIPVLVISGDLDANTPTSAGRKVAHQFAHATLAEIHNAGHVPTDGCPCAMALGIRFVATTSTTANTRAGTAAQRRTLAVVAATAPDLQQQAGVRDAFGSAAALCGGRYINRDKRVRLIGVRVVRDASVSGELAPFHGRSPAPCG